ncbi:MAG: metallophosphoesterase [Marmoricola sp.]
MSHFGRGYGPALLTLALVASGCGATHGSRATDRTPGDTVYSVASAAELRVVAAGDIACEPGLPASGTNCQQAATAAVARGLRPDLVLTLGDHQYDANSTAEFAGSYDKSWGALLSLTRPTVGNHEYKTPQAEGYYTYFESRQPGPPGYYRVTADGWNIYVLNSNCDRVSCATEATWLDRQMTAHPAKCSIVTMHHPRYSSGLEHGNNTAVKPLWAVAYKHHNDLVLSGHEHDYERFWPKDADNHVRRYRGMAEFVVGTGGKNLYHLGARKRGSIYYQARTAGVLFLGLAAGSYRWAYRSIGGSTLDSGRSSCH